MFTQNGDSDTATVAAPQNGQASALYGIDAFAQLVQQNSILMAQMVKMQHNMAMQSMLPLKAALERKRLRVIADCPPIGKDLLVQFKTGGEYSTTDTNVVKNTLNPLLGLHGISYTCTPIAHTVNTQSNGSYLYKVQLQFCIADTETGYTEPIAGEWYGIWIGSLDKGYASAITNGIGKFLINYFNVASFDRPDEYATDANGNPVIIKEQRSGRKQSNRQVSAPATTEQAPTKSELDYGRAKAVLSAIKTPEAVKAKYEELLKLKSDPYDKAAAKRAFIERYYQLTDLDLSDENQYKFITENWKGTLYTPNGKQQHYRIYVMDAEIAIRSEETANNLQKLAQFKKCK